MLLAYKMDLMRSKLGKKRIKTEHYRLIRNDLLPPQQEVFITASFGTKLQLHRGDRQGI